MDNEYTEIITQMIKALEDAEEVRKEYADALTKLEEENQVLAETIKNNKIGNVVSEQRKLRAENRKYKEEIENVQKECEELKAEYNQKVKRAAILIKDVKSKKGDVDDYIDKESEKKLTALKKDMEDKINELENKCRINEENIRNKNKKITFSLLIISLVLLIMNIIQIVL